MKEDLDELGFDERLTGEDLLKVLTRDDPEFETEFARNAHA
jgi:hypothetical protein